MTDRTRGRSGNVNAEADSSGATRAPDTGRKVAEQAKEAAGKAAEQAKAAAGQAAGQAKAAAGQAAGQAREQAASRVAGQKERAAHSLGSMAQALRATGQQLREQDQAELTPYAERAAAEVERFSSYIEGHDIGEMVDDMERFARRQPALFVGGAFMLGLMGARFLRSTTPQRYQSSRYPLARREDQADLYGRTQHSPSSAGVDPGSYRKG